MHYKDIIFCLYTQAMKADMVALGYKGENSMLNKGELYISQNRSSNKPTACVGTALPSYADPIDYLDAPYLTFDQMIKLTGKRESSFEAGDGWVVRDA